MGAYNSKGVDKNRAKCNMGFGRITKIYPAWQGPWQQDVGKCNLGITFSVSFGDNSQPAHLSRDSGLCQPGTYCEHQLCCVRVIQKDLQMFVRATRGTRHSRCTLPVPQKKSSVQSDKWRNVAARFNGNSLLRHPCHSNNMNRLVHTGHNWTQQRSIGITVVLCGFAETSHPATSLSG